MKASQIFNSILIAVVVAAFLALGGWIKHWHEEGRILQKMVERLSADSRIAEVLVTKSEFDEVTKKIKTTIKFMEYDAQGKPLLSKYFTFYGNLIQFQSLVIRFQDRFVKLGDRLRGKSAYLFMKAFVLDGKQTQVFDITKAQTVPEGYKVSETGSEFEKELWKHFWSYALDPVKRDHAGVKNAQIEAPGSIFVPGTIYTLRIEHHGGIRIDARPVPEILKGEKV